MESITKLSHLIHCSYYYEKASYESILQGIDEAINQDKLDIYGVYTHVLRGIIKFQRVDILEKIYDTCENNKRIYEELKTDLISQSFITKKFIIIDFFIDKKLPFNYLDNDDSMALAISSFPLPLLKKIHDNSYDLTQHHLPLLNNFFKELCPNFEAIDYLISIGFSIDNSYPFIAKQCFNVNCDSSKDKIDYLEKQGINLNRDNNILLMYAIQSGMYELLDHLLSKNIDLFLADKKISHSLIYCIRDDNITMLDYIIKKGLKFDINNQDFVELFAGEDAINIFEYCVPLGLDINLVKNHAGPKLKELIITQFYNKMDYSIDIKNNTHKISKNKI